MNHNELVELAAQWLAKNRCSVVITEMTSAACETPDAIGWHDGRSFVIECKASRSDFLADRKKNFRVHPEKGMGNLRYYMAESGIIMAADLPAHWGLLIVSNGKIQVVAEAQTQFETNYRTERILLLSALRRIGQNPPKGVSVKCYAIETMSRTTLGISEQREENE